MADINVTMPNDLNTKGTSVNGTISYAHCSALNELKNIVDTLDVGDSRTIELENQILSLNDLTFANGNLLNKTYVVRTNIAGRNITGRPDDTNKVPFILEVESIEWNNEIDYTTKQTYYQVDDYNIYMRYCTSGIWSEWTTIDDAKYGAAGISLGLVKSGGDVTISEGIITIKDGFISNDKITNISGDKITSGTIDASKTDIVNINASNITSGVINGELLEDGTISSDKLSTDIHTSIDSANTNASAAVDKAEQAELVANAAKMSADGKNTVYYQATVPLGANVNDIWFNTAADNRMSVYDGTKWVEEQFGSGAISDQAISADKIASEVNTKLDTAFENAEMALGDSLDALNLSNQVNTVITNWCYDNDVTYINGGQIYTGTVTAQQIAANTITANEIAVGTITAREIMAGTITAESGVLAEACIKEAYIQDAAITAAKIAEATIGTAHISDLSVTNAKLADLAVTNAKIADATIESAKIVSLDAGKITTGYLSADRIEAGSLSINQFDTSTRTLISDAVTTSSEALGTATENGERINWVAEQTETNTTSISAIDGQITTLISRVEATEADIEVVQDDVTIMTGNYNSLTESYNQIKSTVDGHVQTIGQHSDSITNLTDANTQLTTTVSEISDKQSSLEQNVNGFMLSVEETTSTINQTLEEVSKDTGEALAGLSQTNKALNDAKGQWNADMNAVETRITEEYNAAIGVKADEITQSVSSLKTTVEGQTSTLSEIHNSIITNANAISFQKTTIEKVQEDLTATTTSVNKINEWAEFDGAQLTLHTSVSEFKTVLTEDELGFYKGTNKVAWASDDDFYANQLRAQSELTVGFVPDEGQTTGGYLIIKDEGTNGYSFILGG